MRVYLFLILLIPVLPALQGDMPVTGDNNDVVDLTGDLYYYKNNEDGLTYQQALQHMENGRFVQNPTGKPLNFGFDRSEYWFYTSFVVESGSNKIFHIPYTYHEKLELYAEYDGQWQHVKTGNLEPFSTRGPLQPVDYAWPMSFNESGKARILIKVRSGSPIIMAAELQSVTNYINSSTNKDLLYGIFFGVLTIMFLYNLCLYLIIKDPAYLYYILIVLLNIAIFSSVSGYAFKYLYPNNPEINQYIRELFLSLLIIPTSLFAISFLELKKYVPFCYKLLRVMIFIGALLSITVIPGHIFGFSPVILSIHSLILLGAGIASRIKGNKTASIYILAWSGYLLGGILMTLRSSGTLPAMFLTDHGAEIGAVLEVFLLALALAYRYKKIRNEKFGLQKENIRLIENQNTILEEKVKARTDMLNSALALVKKQHDDLTSKNVEMNFSISYAQKIQQAIFPAREKLLGNLTDVVIFYQPKDTLSGDFAFFESRGNHIFVAVADCTGHGVPGALLSMAGYNLFYDAINVELLTEPRSILEYLNDNLHIRLNQNNPLVGNGMEVGLCVINKDTREAKFCGAQRPLLIIDKNKGSKIIRGKKSTLGNISDNPDHEFFDYNFNLDGVELLYLYTDGFQDQFGGEDDKKYLSKNLVDLLRDIFTYPGEIQEKRLKEEFNKWKGNGEQVDDVLILGFRP